MKQTTIIFVVLVTAATATVSLAVHDPAGPVGSQARVRELLNTLDPYGLARAHSESLIVSGPRDAYLLRSAAAAERHRTLRKARQLRELMAQGCFGCGQHPYVSGNPFAAPIVDDPVTRA